ncbi:bacterial protein of unknown function (Gcw_chp) [mine drainage metagenome]|uniref:Choline dehydrogenase n=1 Tax=mine drainage metagenome TaxID=410659 RepID=A0A1J5RIV4_9ZZZZ
MMRKSMLVTALFGMGAVMPMLAMADEVAPAAAPAAPAAAAAPAPNWTFPGSVGLVSDYLWHGQTQTWGKPALQAGIEADHASGFYAGVWGSNVSSHWLPNANLETDWSVGFRNTFATDFRYDFGGTYVYYPDGNFNKSPAAVAAGTPYLSSKLNTVELYGILGWKWFSVKGGYNPTKFYGWNTNNSTVGSGFAGDKAAGVTGSTNGSGYVMASASYDIPGVTGLNLAAEVGRQMIANSTNLDWTWYKVGLTKSFDGGWAVNGAVSGTTGTNAYQGFNSFDLATDTKNIDSTKFVVSLSKSF